MSFADNFPFANITVGKEGDVLVIAEAGVAHFGDAGKMDALIDMSVDAGADVFKTQAFVTKDMISSTLPDWQERMKIKEVTSHFIERAKARCESKGIAFMCTAHDQTSLSWIDKMGVDAYKIGSGECGNLPFIKEIAGKGKPLFLSTGMYSLAQIDQTVQTIDRANCQNIALLHCVTSYPIPTEQVNLLSVPFLKDRFNFPIGYSDHTVDHTACIGASALGARVIEKHITLEFDIPNAQDWKVSCGPEDFPHFVKACKEAALMRGLLGKPVQECEKSGQSWAIKRLVAKQALKAGHILQIDDLIAKRCSDGLGADQIDQLVGKTLTKNVDPDHPILTSMFS